MRQRRVLSCAGWLTLSVPEGWASSQSEECISLFRSHNGVGVLQLSTYHRERWQEDPAVTASELLNSVLHEHALTAKDILVRQGVQRGAVVVYGEFFGPGPREGESDLWRVWCFANGARVVLVSYLCNRSLAFQEADEVEAMIHSIELACD